MGYSDDQIREVMDRFGITQSDILYAQNSYKTLSALKARAKKAYRRLALEWHPDRAKDDPIKTKLFQLATHVVKEIEAMEVNSKPRQIRWAVRIRSMGIS